MANKRHWRAARNRALLEMLAHEVATRVSLEAGHELLRLLGPSQWLWSHNMGRAIICPGGRQQGRSHAAEVYRSIVKDFTA